MPRRLTVTKSSEEVRSESSAAVSPFELASLLIRRKRLIGIAVLGSMILAAVITLLIPNKYVSTASMLPSGGIDKMADLKSLAGLSGMINADENGSELYPVILASHTIRDAVLAGVYVYQDDGESKQTTLPEYLNEDDPDKLRKGLGEITSVRLDKKTGVIELGVETEYPAFSQAILGRYIDELEAFNLHKRRTQAGERAAYLERELAVRKADLAEAEDSLAAFQGSNRDWMTASDPEVAMLLGRLQREVQTRNQTCLYLLQEYEIAKLDARKDVPVVRILDQPSLPTQKSSPKRGLIVLMVGLLALIGMSGGVLVVEGLRRTEGQNRVSLEMLQADFSREFPRVNRLIGRSSGSVAAGAAGAADAGEGVRKDPARHG